MVKLLLEEEKMELNNLIIKSVTKEELNKYLNFIEQGKKKMKHPEWMGDLTKEDYEYLLDHGALLYRWTTDDETVAVGTLFIPTKNDLNKFLCNHLNPAEVIEFGPQMVNNDYVGKGIQRIIIKHLETKALSLGYMHALVTVHPNNHYSLNNFLKLGYEEVTRVTLKRGERIVLIKSWIGTL